MRKIINIGNKKNALNTLLYYRTNEYVPFDVKIINTHIKELNDLIGLNIFSKDSLFINSKLYGKLCNQLEEKAITITMV